MSAAVPPPGTTTIASATSAMTAMLRASGMPSKSSAAPARRNGSRVFDDDAFEDVGDLLAGVDRVFEAVEDVLPADHDHRVDPVLEQGGERLPRYPVTFVLQAVDLDEVMGELAAEAAQA